MAKYGFVYTNDMGRLICDAIWKEEGGKLVEMMTEPVEKDGKWVDEVMHYDSELLSFDELEAHYARRSQAVLVFNEAASDAEALKMLGTENSDFGNLQAKQEDVAAVVPKEIATADEELSVD